MKPAIAIVGMACRYPDANSPAELWENVLAQRRAFRRIPPERLRLEDYYSEDQAASDYMYITQAAVLKDYEFDRVNFRVAGSTYRSADLAHWLALDVAAQALVDAGFLDGEGLNRETTGVVLGNTLTGEFSRANQMRLRWPYVRRTVDAALIEQGWSPEQRRDFLLNLEAQYKAPFPLPDEESLAGGLSNTIAGRICNYFDFKGGGYTVDGACASSLLAMTTACSALVAGDLDVALAGGVDLSLDPFELVGFARTSALAPEKMRVYDARSAGFWPGEGCGFVVLMRHEDALAQQRRIYGLIRGWGISSDGNGGITRPELEGQILAIQRAYRRANFGIETVAYFEGHGTGTAVGDATELRTLSQARRQAAPEAPPAVIGSVKANIGHTKAAAGVAGVIKAAMALHTRIIPPNTGNDEPHPELAGNNPALKVLAQGQCWPADQPARAGVSAMGFGGINTHLVLEGTTTGRCYKTPDTRDQRLLSSPQDAELFLLSTRDAKDLQEQVEHLLTFVNKLSLSELTDLAAHLQGNLVRGQIRAAIVAATPAELAQRLETLRDWLGEGMTHRLDLRAGVFIGSGTKAPRLGFLFPGQGSPSYLGGGALRRRFDFIEALYTRPEFPQNGHDRVATAVAQPAIVTASLAALRVLNRLGISAGVAVGHSLGEITALHWAGAMDEETLLRIALVRGQAMMELGHPTGTMASIHAGHEAVKALLNGEAVSIACLNTPRQTVISGTTSDVATVIGRAKTQGLEARHIAVSHAFHSPLVAAAAQPLADHLAGEKLRSVQRTVFSTITGTPLTRNTNLRDLLYRQVTEPVRFTEAVAQAVQELDLLIEVGPSRTLSGLVAEFVEPPAIALDAGGPSLKGLLQAAGAAFALGVPLNHEILFADRFTRPFDLDWQARFLINPCELAPAPDDTTAVDWSTLPIPKTAETTPSDETARGLGSPTPFPETSEKDTRDGATKDTVSLVRRLVAERIELPLEAVSDRDRLLSDLHLNSITVSQIVAEAARCLDLPAPVAPTEFADVTVIDIVEILEEIVRNGGATTPDREKLPPGVDSWIRSFTTEWVERPLPNHHPRSGSDPWQVIASLDYPLTVSLQQALAEAAGGGVVVCLPPEPGEHHLSLLLESARIAFSFTKPPQFVLVQHNGGGAAFARTLHLEEPEITTTVVDVPLDHPQAAAWVAAEAMAATGYTEVRYDDSGRRWEPVMRLLPLHDESMILPLSTDDVLLVTGGGKGITAECALSLARETGLSLALFGRSKPEQDSELAANLERMAEAGVAFRYIPVDVTDPEAVQTAVHEVEATLGPVTGILHGAARNVPQRLRTLDEESFRRTLAPKVQGARNLLAAIDPAQLRLFVSFGSIIARIGLPGEADYGLANEWLADLTERFQREYPTCRCLTIDWSVWAGAGMGERLGTLEGLVQQGISPIPLDAGVKMLHRLLAVSELPSSVVVAGRFDPPATVQVEQPALPFWRFL
ncbi:MAG TPA: type I polyketide synthase, partial [Anaerolineae bacterium]